METTSEPVMKIDIRIIVVVNGHFMNLLRVFATQVSRLRRLMRRAPSSKYNKLKEIKEKAREYGWTAKGDSDDSEDEPCQKSYIHTQLYCEYTYKYIVYIL